MCSAHSKDSRKIHTYRMMVIKSLGKQPPGRLRQEDIKTDQKVVRI
jgi:hypothetical protein